MCRARGGAGRVRAKPRTPAAPLPPPTTAQVFRIDQHEELAQKSELRENARREFEKERAARKAARNGGGAAAAAAAAEPGLPVRRPAAELVGDERAGGGSANGDAPGSDGPKPAPEPAAAAAAGTPRRGAPWRWCFGSCGGSGGGSGGGHAGAGMATRRSMRVLRRSEARLTHPAYYHYLAYRVDKWAFLALLLLYVLASEWLQAGERAGGKVPVGATQSAQAAALGSCVLGADRGPCLHASPAPRLAVVLIFTLQQGYVGTMAE